MLRTPAEQSADDSYLSGPQVRKRYGDVTEQTLWRWLRDEKLNFPQPVYIGQNRYWKICDLENWERHLPNKSYRAREKRSISEGRGEAA